MPSPVGHSLAGLIVGFAMLPDMDGHQARRRLRWLPRRISTAQLGIGVAAACLPDIDFLWGRHNMETHSIGAAALAGLAVWLWARGSSRPASPARPARPAHIAAAVALAWASHVLLDWLGSDDMPPIGVYALWPFSNEPYFANAFLFDAISRRYWLPGFVAHNVWAITKEVVMLGPIAAALWWYRARRS